ncbi:MAG: flagellin [Phycisphaeraceae bacterium]|nr:flagellin [Phycisphaeraceae bacterium]MCW5754613.1 flagellin [Phycisphaeraceae bacterium]
MSRINTNISSVVAQSRLGRTQQELNMRLERLSTGIRINRGRDDPAGLIIAERLRADVAGVNQGIANAERASAVIATTEAALAEVNDLLNSIKALIVESANSGAASSAERDANQLQIDSAIDSITRISNTASFGGLKLLDGSRDYTLSGVAGSAMTRARVFNANFVNSTNLAVEVDVLASAQQGNLFLNGDITPVPGQITSAMTLEIRGPKGVSVISIASGQPLGNLVTAVNNLTSLTGITAELINGNPNSGLVFKSSDYGANAFVSVTRVDKPQNPADDNWQLFRFADGVPMPAADPFDWADTNLLRAERDTGQNVTALVNGNLATGDGLRVSVNSPTLGVELLLNELFATLPDADASTFTITGGGALFQLGPEVTAQQQVSIGIGSVAASNLGGTLVAGSVEFLSSLKRGGTNSIDASLRRNDFTAASEILDRAIDEITVSRGRLGAFERNVLVTNVRSLQSALENLSASTSLIRDADFALETSSLTRAQILASSGTTVLGLANQQSQQVLQLLG